MTNAQIKTILRALRLPYQESMDKVMANKDLSLTTQIQYRNEIRAFVNLLYEVERVLTSQKTNDRAQRASILEKASQ